jgi:hypothetical protein
MACGNCTVTKLPSCYPTTPVPGSYGILTGASNRVNMMARIVCRDAHHVVDRQSSQLHRLVVTLDASRLVFYALRLLYIADRC